MIKWSAYNDGLSYYVNLACHNDNWQFKWSSVKYINNAIYIMPTWLIYFKIVHFFKLLIWPLLIRHIWTPWVVDPCAISSHGCVLANPFSVWFMVWHAVSCHTSIWFIEFTCTFLSFLFSYCFSLTWQDTCRIPLQKNMKLLFSFWCLN